MQGRMNACMHVIQWQLRQGKLTSNLSLLDLACATNAVSTSSTLFASGSSLANRACSTATSPAFGLFLVCAAAAKEHKA